MLRKFTTLCSPLPCVEEKSVQLSQRSVLGVGKAKYVTQETLHSICELCYYILFDTR